MQKRLQKNAFGWYVLGQPKVAGHGLQNFEVSALEELEAWSHLGLVCLF